MIKKKVLLKTRDDIEREGIKIVSSIDENDSNSISLPVLFEISIKLYSLIKNYPEFYQHSRLDELVELTFQRYRSILRVKQKEFIFRFNFYLYLVVFKSSTRKSQSGKFNIDIYIKKTETKSKATGNNYYY